MTFLDSDQNKKVIDSIEMCFFTVYAFDFKINFSYLYLILKNNNSNALNFNKTF